MKAKDMVLLAALAAALAITGTISGLRLYAARETAWLAGPETCVIVDAGHGGEDGGATSVSGALESGINLQIARRANDLLVFLGCRARMTRASDEAIYDSAAKTIGEKKASDLKNRVKLVNGTPGALLLSIHQNTFPDGQYSGAQVFYAPTDGSKALAERVQSSLRADLDPENDRQAKPADAVYLMNHIRCAGVLVECGFLSNREEDRLLQSAEYQKKLALAIDSGILRWAGGEGKDEI